MPKVSVVIPVYNVEKYLRDCLDSVINQSLKDIEIICVNDGSTDTSGDICEEYAKKDSRIKVIHQENQYVGIARNNGMSVATGDFLIFLDSDDEFDINMLEKMYSKAIETNADITICHEYYYNTKSCIKGVINWNSYCFGQYKNNEIFSAKDMTGHLLNFCPLWPWDKLYNRKFLVDNNLKFMKDRIVEASEDLVFVAESLLQAERIIIMPDKFVTHKYHKLSLEANRNIYSSTVALKTLRDFLKEQNIYEVYEQSLINLVLGYYLWDLSAAKKSKKSLLLREIKKGFIAFGINKYPEDYFYAQSQYTDYLKLTNKIKYIKRKLNIVRSLIP